MADKLAKLKEAALRLSNELWKVDTRAEAVSWCAAADEVLRAFAAAPQAPSGQQAEPTELLRAMVGWYSTHGTLHHSDVMGKAKAFLAGQQSERPAPVVREFTNELGNRIKITIEGPTSMSENILTPMEAKELQAALAASQAERPAVKEDGNHA